MYAYLRNARRKSPRAVGSNDSSLGQSAPPCAQYYRKSSAGSDHKNLEVNTIIMPNSTDKEIESRRVKTGARVGTAQW